MLDDISISRRDVMTTGSSFALGAAGSGGASFASKKIAFVGNCQMVSLLMSYKSLLPQDMKQNARYVVSYSNPSQEDRTIIEGAEILVWQLTEYDQKVADINSSAKRYLVPVVNGQFIWPYSGEPRPGNPHPPWFPDGPYPAESGDAFLNALILQGVDADEGVRKWKEADEAALKRVTRMAEIVLDLQRKRDERCGDYRIADLIHDRLSHEPLFRSRGHLRAPLFTHMATVLFTQMGLNEADIHKAVSIDWGKTVPDTEVPVHPTIAAAFGMTYIRPDTTYGQFREGRFTAEEVVRRYMLGAWSPALQQGIDLAHKQKYAEAVEMLEKGLEEAPRSDLGRWTLTEVTKRAQGG